MKRLLCIFVAMSVVFSCFSLALSAENSEFEKIILSVKQRICDVEQYSDFSINEHQGADGKKSYSLRWSDDSEGYKSVYVNVTSDLFITMYSVSSDKYLSNRPRIKNIKREEVKSKAQELLYRLNPMINGEFVITDYNTSESLWDNDYSFGVSLMVNSVEVPEISGSVSVGEAGDEITYFSINYYEGADFEATDNLIDAEAAQKAYMEQIGLKMEYFLVGEEAIPMYISVDSDAKISALDAIGFVPLKSYSGEVFREESTTADKVANPMAASGGSGLSKTETDELLRVSGLMTKEEGAQLIFDNPFIAIDKNDALMGYDVYKQNDNTYIGNYCFGERYASVSMDMKTGEIKSFYIPISPDTKKKSITDSEAERILNDGAKYLAKEKFNEYKKDGGSEFVRYVNSIPFRHDRIHLSVSKEYGIITSYNISYSQCDFADIVNAISVQEAENCLFEQLDYDVRYERHVENNKTLFRLIYDFDNSYIRLNALTGKLHDAQENVVFNGYSDISGHYAEHIINTLAAYGVRTEGDKFTPDAAITQGDYAKLLMCIMRRYDVIWLKSDMGANAQWLINQGIINKLEFSEEKNITRLDAAKLLIRAIGAEEYAKLEDIYNCPFIDVSKDKGYVSILYGMGVFNGDGYGNFRPNENITYAEAAVIIYNYLMYN